MKCYSNVEIQKKMPAFNTIDIDLDAFNDEKPDADSSDVQVSGADAKAVSAAPAE
jgi:hypothetical protein